MALIPLVASVLIYAAFSYLSITGRQAQVLANNQQAGVNIGINERRNILISYIYSGAILGFATMIYASTASSTRLLHLCPRSAVCLQTCSRCLSV